MGNSIWRVDKRDAMGNLLAVTNGEYLQTSYLRNETSNRLMGIQLISYSHSPGILLLFMLGKMAPHTLNAGPNFHTK